METQQIHNVINVKCQAAFLAAGQAEGTSAMKSVPNREVLRTCPGSSLSADILSLAVWFQYKLTPIPLPNIKMVKEAAVSGMVKPQKMQVTNKQMEKTHKGFD